MTRTAGAVAAVSLLFLAVPANAYAPPGATQLVSVALNGPADGHSTWLAMSDDGKHVAFSSGARNLVPVDTNPAPDLFVRDLESGKTELISRSSSGEQGLGESSYPSISSDGRVVAFWSKAPNLVPEDINSHGDVFVHDRVSGSTEPVSISSSGSLGDAESTSSAISADGRYVAFSSQATNLVPGDTNGHADVFLRDRLGGTTVLVSAPAGGSAGNGRSTAPAISADGTFVAFASYASNLVPGDTNGLADVFVANTVTGAIERVSLSSDGTQGNATSDQSHDLIPPAISSDGRYVAFSSQASNLVPADTNGRPLGLLVLTNTQAAGRDVFVRDRATGTTERVSVDSDGIEGNSRSWSPALSGDGRLVAFRSNASSLVPGDTNATSDEFLRDRLLGTTERVSVSSAGEQQTGHVGHDHLYPSISADGRMIAFVSSASNLVTESNRYYNVYARDRGEPLGIVGPLAAASTEKGVTVAGRARLAGKILSEVADPGNDGDSNADELGAQITGASISYRPEEEDLLIRWSLSALPRVPAAISDRVEGIGSSPGIVYGARLKSRGVVYEIRALRAAVSGGPPPRLPHMALYRCAPDCVEQAALTGSIGTTGDEISVSVPIGALQLAAGDELQEVRAFTAVGEAAPGGMRTLDEADLAPSVVPPIEVTVGIAQASTAEEDVAFTKVAETQNGAFSATLATNSLPPGTYRLWARSCLGKQCSRARSKTITI